MLHEFGLITEQVAAQCDAVALAALSEASTKWAKRRSWPSTVMLSILTQTQLVVLAGIPVWRALQANLGLVMNMSGHGGKGMQDKDAALSSEATLTMLALKGAAERDTWYQTNLSSTQERAISTKLNPFYGDASDRAVQAAAANNRLRMITTPLALLPCRQQQPKRQQFFSWYVLL